MKEQSGSFEAILMCSAMSPSSTSVLTSIFEWVGVSIYSDIWAITLLIFYKTDLGPIPVILARAFARNGEARNGRQTKVDTDRGGSFV